MVEQKYKNQGNFFRQIRKPRTFPGLSSTEKTGNTQAEHHNNMNIWQEYYNRFFVDPPIWARFQI